jgi:hypothetical protein
MVLGLLCSKDSSASFPYLASEQKLIMLCYYNFKQSHVSSFAVASVQLFVYINIKYLLTWSHLQCYPLLATICSTVEKYC